MTDTMDPGESTQGAAAPLSEVALVQGTRMPLVDARLALTDDGVARGDGVFETLGVWQGRIFRLGDHLARLQASLRAIALPPADLDLLAAEAGILCGDVAADAALRIYVTASGTRVLTLSHQPVRPPPRHLHPRAAPWIRPLDAYEPSGAKTMSYSPNMTATRLAQAAGADDALLVATDGHVLEGPTFCLLWVVDGVVHGAPIALGVVDSISRRTLVELARRDGREVRESLATVEQVAAADEVLICSSVRDVISVRRIGATLLEGATPVRDQLSTALDLARRGG